jgi:predicted transcriptional regulator
MSMQVTVTLPDDTYRRAEYLARLTGRDIADVLAETIHLSLQPLGVQHAVDQPVAGLSDADVLAAADSAMDPAQEGRFSDLLEARHALQAGHLTQEDRAALLALMQVYQEGLLRKAQALHEAVQRGLRPPLAP